MGKTLAIGKFNRLPCCERLDIVERQSTYLQVYRIHGSCKIALFDLQDYYVEVWLNQATDSITKTVAFIDYNKLNPFLGAIDLSRIYSVQ